LPVDVFEGCWEGVAVGVLAAEFDVGVEALAALDALVELDAFDEFVELEFDELEAELDPEAEVELELPGPLVLVAGVEAAS
jgi:hypothetical protein